MGAVGWSAGDARQQQQDFGLMRNIRSSTTTPNLSAPLELLIASIQLTPPILPMK